MSGPMDQVNAMHERFDRRRRVMYDMLKSMDGIECVEPLGAFYACPSVAGVLGRDIRGSVPSTSLELASIVLEKAGVAFVPGEAFGAPGYARFSFALGDDDLVEGLTRFGDLIRDAA